MKVDKSKWERKALSEISTIIMGQSPDSTTFGFHCKGLPFYQGNADFGSLHPTPRVYCFKPVRIALEQDILISVRAPIGDINIANEECCIGRGLASIRPYEDIVCVNFLKYSLFASRSVLNNQGVGVTFKAIGKNVLYNFSIKFPSLSEQQQIASELDALQAVIDGLQEQLYDYDNLARAIFLEMFGDPAINSFSFPIKELEELCTIYGRIGFRGYKKTDLVPTPKEGAISLSPSNIEGLSLDYTKCSYISWTKYYESPEIIINDGDILVVKTGSSYGKCAKVSQMPHKATINPQFVVLKNLKCENDWLLYILATDYVKDKYKAIVGGAAIPTFSQANMKRIKLPLPPLSLQQTFATKVEAIETQKAMVREQLADAKVLMAERMDYYFG